MDRREPPASYSNPRGKPSGERVVAICAVQGGYEITTEHEGTRCTYHRCKRPMQVGELVTRPIASRTKTIHAPSWSPFSGTDDD